MAFLKTKDNINLYYDFLNKDSKKIPLVFVHGFLVNWTYLKRQIQFFKKEGYPVVYFDLRGHGRSDLPANYKNLTSKYLVEDLECILNECGIKKAVLVGHSLGGMISLLFCVEHPKRVARLVILNSAAGKPDRFERLQKIAGKLWSKMKDNPARYFFENFLMYWHKMKKYKRRYEDLSKNNHITPEFFFIRRMLKSSPLVISYFARELFTFDFKNVSGISCPVLVVGADRDEFFSEKEILKFAAKIKKSLVKIFPGGHDLVFKNPKLISQEIKQFLHTKEEYWKESGSP